jgi:hypothetical protein
MMIAAVLLVLLLPDGLLAAENGSTYSREEISSKVESFFTETSQGLAKIVEKVFADLGQPVGFISGTEAGGALVLGLRYGQGVMNLKRGLERKVYWQGPSLGYDFGGNAAKVFTLVYGLEDVDTLFSRFPGAEGSAYFMGGFSMNYHRFKGVTLVPIRSGVGFRIGASLGYLHFSREERINPL